METVIENNIHFLELLQDIYELKGEGEKIPENLIRHTLDFGKKIDIPQIELAVLEAILKKPLLH